MWMRVDEEQQATRTEGPKQGAGDQLAKIIEDTLDLYTGLTANEVTSIEEAVTGLYRGGAWDQIVEIYPLWLTDVNNKVIGMKGFDVASFTGTGTPSNQAGHVALTTDQQLRSGFAPADIIANGSREQIGMGQWVRRRTGGVASDWYLFGTTTLSDDRYWLLHSYDADETNPQIWSGHFGGLTVTPEFGRGLVGSCNNDITSLAVSGTGSDNIILRRGLRKDTATLPVETSGVISTAEFNFNGSYNGSTVTGDQACELSCAFVTRGDLGDEAYDQGLRRGVVRALDAVGYTSGFSTAPGWLTGLVIGDSNIWAFNAGNLNPGNDPGGNPANSAWASTVGGVWANNIGTRKYGVHENDNGKTLVGVVPGELATHIKNSDRPDSRVVYTNLGGVDALVEGTDWAAYRAAWDAFMQQVDDLGLVCVWLTHSGLRRSWKDNLTDWENINKEKWNNHNSLVMSGENPNVIGVNITDVLGGSSGREDLAYGPPVYTDVDPTIVATGPNDPGYDQGDGIHLRDEAHAQILAKVLERLEEIEHSD